MVAKLKVRRWLLKDLRNANNFDMQSASLWNHDIFSKEAFTKLRSHNKNILDLSKVLNIAFAAVTIFTANDKLEARRKTY